MKLILIEDKVVVSRQCLKYECCKEAVKVKFLKYESFTYIFNLAAQKIFIVTTVFRGQAKINVTNSVTDQM